MAMIVQHNLTAMNSNRMLGITTGQQAKTSEKLASGYRINRAADDAAGLSISEKMRKQIRGLSRASDNAQDGISAVQTAEGALAEVQDMLQRMNELAVQASNGTNSETDRDSIQAEIDQLVTEIDRVSETTKFNETYLLRGDVNAANKEIDYQYKAADVTSQTLYYLDDSQTLQTVEKGEFVSTLDTSVEYFTSTTTSKVGEAYTTNTFVSTTDVLSTAAYIKAADGNFKLVSAGEVVDTSATYYSVTFTTDGTVSSAVALTTGYTTTGYVTNTDVYDKNGTRITSGTSLGTTAPTATDYFTSIGDGYFNTANAVTLADYTTSEVTQFLDSDGNEIAANGLYKYFDGENYVSGLYTKTGDTLTPAGADLVSEYVDTSETQDVGALNLRFHVGADATAQNQISVDIDAMSAEILGVKGVSVAGKDDVNALNAIETIAAALDKVSAQRSSLGAIQNRLEHTIANLDNVVENTTSAESQIRDTDMAEEMVEYSKNNILAQAGQSMLAQANQSTQGVLSLLQ